MKLIVIGVVSLMALVIAAFASQPGDQAADQKKADQPAAVAAGGDETKNDAKEDKEEEKLVYIQMTTSMGDIFLELNNELAPISTKNFLEYTESGYYDGTIFHRVIENFMIQGGAFTPDMKQKKPGKAIHNEWTNGLSNMRGTIAMARLGGRANSATAQFFINVADNKGLDTPRDGSGYAVFGRVVKGMDVVDKIRGVSTGNKGGHGDVPNKPIVIEKVVKLNKDQVKELGLVEAEG
jgi:cyclophilin family peptidyl-prolyl cis-trans isomerase